MNFGRSIRWLALATALCSVAGCSSGEQRAAVAAAEADQLLSQGLYQPAMMRAGEATRLQDDNSDYWLILGRTQVAAAAYQGAYVSYQRVLELDRGNVEALSLLVQMAVATRQLDKADEYADQLMVLRPDDLTALVAKGRTAQLRGDHEAAAGFADRVLAINPGELQATILKARVAIAMEKLPEAVKILEDSFALGGDPEERLGLLRGLYIRRWDVPGYQRTIARLAGAAAQDVTVQLEYADMLYQAGRGDQARAVVTRLMRAHPQDVTLSSRIVELWRRQGSDAIPADRIASLADGASLQMRTAYAQFANFIGRPDLAIALFPADLAAAPTAVANADAKAVYADALNKSGRQAEAMAIAKAVLEFDESQPRALTVRADLLAKAGRFDLAIADARRAVGVDGDSPSTRLFLAKLLFQHGDEALGVGALRAAVDAMPRDPRLAEALAVHLAGQRRFDEAADILRALVRSAPVSLRAVQTRRTLCGRMPASSCAAPADRTLGPSVGGPVAR